eukprot:449313-Amphidinium_carterae.1
MSDLAMATAAPAEASSPSNPLMVYTGDETLPLTCCFCKKTKKTWNLLFQHIRLDHKRSMKSMAGTVILDKAKGFLRQQQKASYAKKKVRKSEQEGEDNTPVEA